MIASRRKEKCDKLVKDIHAKGYKMDIHRLAAVMPTARLREKLSPGILVFFITMIYLTVQHI